VNEDIEQRLRQIQRDYVGFLDDSDADEPVYEAAIKDMINAGGYRLVIDVNDLRKALPERAKALIESRGAFDELAAVQRALKEVVASIDPTYAKAAQFHVGFQGSFGSRHLSARTLAASKHINNLVCIEGIVTKVSLVRPKVTTSVHYCPATSKFMERNYSDMTSVDAYPSTAAYPTQDEDGNPLQTEYGLSSYKDHQTITLQELPEKAPTGQLPRAVDAICEYDLVDMCKPGDRVQVVATFRALPGKQNGYTTGSFRTVLLVNNLIQKGQEENMYITGDDVQKCKKLCKQEKKRIFSLLSKSLAPSIHGHDYVKKALLCLLLGGVEKVLPNGTRLRGDINLLLIGDPSVAKSQMLRYVLSTAHRAVTTTGRGSSGVGLTAAVTTDQETGERRLEAGAMVLADRGIVCIDEFDKMTDMDRTAIHEVMEQGRVTISKAGIHARLNARCSVLAAANPVYGRYDPFKTPMENIGLQDSLLSRFDLLFILLDTVDVDSDRKIADHVVKVHQYRDPREADGSVTVIKSGAGDLATHRNEGGGGGDHQKELQVWDKSEAGATGGSSGRGRKRSDRLLSPEFVQKYVEIAKVLKPVLTEEAAEMIGEEYSKLRSQDFENSEVARTQPVTARALETLIRLSTAHAKARLSKTVDAEDAETAIELVQFAYFKKVLGKPKKRRHQSDNEDDSDNDDNDEEASEATTNGAAAAATSQETTTTTAEEEEEEDSQSEAAKPSSPKRPRTEAAPEEAPVEVSAERLEEFKRELFTIFESTRQQVLPMDDVRKRIVEEKGFSNAELMVCIEKMTEDNKVMLSSNELYLI